MVQAHQERGHTVVMSSSALAIQALPVARFLGISNVQCNHFELDEHGRLTGGIVKPIVWGATKAAAIQQFCADNDVALQHSYFYADGDEDAASMSVVGCPRPVNPRAGLAAEAACTAGRSCVSPRAGTAVRCAGYVIWRATRAAATPRTTTASSRIFTSSPDRDSAVA